MENPGEKKNVCRVFGMGISPKIWNDAVVICPLATCCWFVHDRPQNAGLGHVLQGVRKMNISARFWPLQQIGVGETGLCFASCSHALSQGRAAPLKHFPGAPAAGQMQESVLNTQQETQNYKLPKFASSESIGNDWQGCQAKPLGMFSTWKPSW